MNTTSKLADNTIAVNKKAKFDYYIEQRYEAGLVLTGWEVKSLRAKRVQINESHVIIKHNAAWLLGAQINPLPSASTHVTADPGRTRKLLLKQDELKKLMGQIEQKGYTLVPLKIYWKRQRVKIEIGLAKGKKTHDKRATIKERDWQREKARTLKTR